MARSRTFGERLKATERLDHVTRKHNLSWAIGQMTNQGMGIKDIIRELAKAGWHVTYSQVQRAGSERAYDARGKIRRGEMKDQQDAVSRILRGIES